MPIEEAEIDKKAAAMEAKQDENVKREMWGCGWEGRERAGRGEMTVGNWISGLFGRW